jgi:hypothetical protein
MCLVPAFDGLDRVRIVLALYVAPVWFTILGIGYQIAKRLAAKAM